MSEFQSRLPDFYERVQRASEAGMIAAQSVVVNAVKRALRGGFTSGAFVTGNLMNSVTRDSPVWDGGEIVGRVGTNVVYALPWELGHMNLFTRRYERQERWRPALLESREAAGQAFARAFGRVMAA